MWFEIKRVEDNKFTCKTRKTLVEGTWEDVSVHMKKTIDGKFERKQKWLARQSKKVEENNEK